LQESVASSPKWNSPENSNMVQYLIKPNYDMKFSELDQLIMDTSDNKAKNKAGRPTKTL